MRKYHKEHNAPSSKEPLEHLSQSDLVRLVETILHALGKQEVTKEWLSPTEAKAMLHITSDSQLYNLRISGKIVYSQPSRKLIFYSRTSIIAYIENGRVH